MLIRLSDVYYKGNWTSNTTIDNFEKSKGIIEMQITHYGYISEDHQSLKIYVYLSLKLRDGNYINRFKVYQLYDALNFNYFDFNTNQLLFNDFQTTDIYGSFLQYDNHNNNSNSKLIYTLTKY